MSANPSPARSSHSRQSSIQSWHAYQPSRLRQSHAASSDKPSDQNREERDSSVDLPAAPHDSNDSTPTTIIHDAVVSARKKVLDGYYRVAGSSNCNNCESGECEHGTLSPRAPSTPRSWDGPTTATGSGSYGGKFDSQGGDMMHSILGDAVADGLIGERTGRADHDEDGGINKMSTTEWLARKHGINRKRTMYVAIPPN